MKGAGSEHKNNNHNLVSVVLLLVGSASGMTGQDLSALKDVFKNDFLFGGAFNRALFIGGDPNAATIVEKHFNTATAENDMKW